MYVLATVQVTLNLNARKTCTCMCIAMYKKLQLLHAHAWLQLLSTCIRNLNWRCTNNGLNEFITETIANNNSLIAGITCVFYTSNCFSSNIIVLICTPDYTGTNG